MVATTTVSTRLRRSSRTHDAYTVRVAGCRVLATVTASPAVARRWVYTTRWRGGRRFLSGAGLTVGLGVQWTPPFRALVDGAEPRPGTLQLCAGHRCLVFQLAQAEAVPDVLRRFLADARVTFVGYDIRSDCRKLRAHHGLAVACWSELRVATGMGNASMERMAERLLGLRGINKPSWVGTSTWDVRRLSKRQVQYACVDAYLSCRLGIHLGVTDNEQLVGHGVDTVDVEEEGGVE